MSITTWGWGSCGIAISTAGWGACPCGEYIPSIIAEFLANSKAYSCVVTRQYVQIRSRFSGNVLFRASTFNIPSRVVSQLKLRSENVAELARSRSEGWPRESNEICEDT